MIAVDLGQSGCRINVDGKLQNSNRGKLAGEQVTSALEANFKEINAKSELVTLSLTGLFGYVSNTQNYLDLCNKYFGAKEVAVIDDGLASLAGALAGQPGVSLTLGGGVVAVGGNGEKLSHSDGLGSHFGDEGGGFWLGSRGLTRALASIDGRDSEKELEQLLKDEIEKFNLLESKNGPEATSLAISCAQKVLESDTKIADSIRKEGAFRLAKTVVSAWIKVGSLEQEFKLTISGGLSKNENYRKLIFENVKALGAKADLIAPAGDNLDGAIWIANNYKNDIPPMLGWARA
jgi:N-acetylglucosamine kinase-like BadF-type ATPase